MDMFDAYVLLINSNVLSERISLLLLFQHLLNKGLGLWNAVIDQRRTVVALKSRAQRWAQETVPQCLSPDATTIPTFLSQLCGTLTRSMSQQAYFLVTLTFKSSVTKDYFPYYPGLFSFPGLILFKFHKVSNSITVKFPQPHGWHCICFPCNESWSTMKHPSVDRTDSLGVESGKVFCLATHSIFYKSELVSNI